MNFQAFQRLEINGGRVEPISNLCRFVLPPIANGYADAQLHNYGRFPLSRHTFPYHPKVHLNLEARFSHDTSTLKGTAGFGFWNAPFADPSLKLPALPKATWFFFASQPNDLPLARTGSGRGWFTTTIDATKFKALAWAPLTPIVLILNQLPFLKRLIWPKVRQSLGISFQQIDLDIQQWHHYEIHWLEEACTFKINGIPILKTPHSPSAPLGFVCWIDNQYMVATANGRFRWGTLQTKQTQWMEIKNLSIES